MYQTVPQKEENCIGLKWQYLQKSWIYIRYSSCPGNCENQKRSQSQPQFAETSIGQICLKQLRKSNNWQNKQSWAALKFNLNANLSSYPHQIPLKMLTMEQAEELVDDSRCKLELRMRLYTVSHLNSVNMDQHTSEIKDIQQILENMAQVYETKLHD